MAEADIITKNVHTTVGGDEFPGGYWSPEVEAHKKYNKELAKNTIEGFKEGAGIQRDRGYLRARAKKGAMARGRAAATKPMEKLSDDFNKKVLKATDAERRGKSKEKYSKQKGNIIRNRAGRRDQETERGYIQDGYDNSTPLDYSKIKHKTL